MDESTKNNLDLLKMLGYVYDKSKQMFWSENHEVYFHLSLSTCNDLLKSMRVIINFEQEMASNRGEEIAKRKIRTSLGLE